MLKYQKYVPIVALVFVGLLSCNLNEGTDGKSDTMSIVLNDSLYQLTNVSGSTYMEWSSIRGDLFGKTLAIKRYARDWKGDTCLFIYYYPRFTNTGSYVQYDTMYNIPNYGMIVKTNSVGNRESGVFYFTIISGNDTLNIKEGNYNIYIKPLE